MAILISVLAFINLAFAYYKANDDISFFAVEQKIKGVTVVAPPKPIIQEDFTKISKISADWVALVPYGFTRKDGTEVVYNLERQWWGEKLEGVESCILLAKSQGLQIMLKPQVWVGRSWIGELNFKTKQDWDKWHESYRNFMFDFAKLAQKHQVEMLCIGTEINKSVEQFPDFWKTLVIDIKKVYSGKLTYSANWDQYEKIKFWSSLDYVGISAYFPLSDSKTPDQTELVKAWKPTISNLKKFAKNQKKPILFTEYGYMSVDGCAGKAWEIEKDKNNRSINHTAQSNAYHAIWEAFSHEPFWAGGFIWKWFPSGMGHEGYPEKDYTPQNKPAEATLKSWFEKLKKV